VSGSGISLAICKSAPRSRQITTPAPHHSVFYRPDALPATQPTASKHWRHTRGVKEHKCTVVELATNIIKYLIDLTFYVLYDTIGDIKLRYNLDVWVQQTLFSPSPIARFVRDRQFPVHDGMNSFTDTESNGIVDIYGCSTVTTALNGPFLTQGHGTDRRTDGRTTALLNAPLYGH